MATVGRSQRFQRRSVVKAAKVGELSAQIGYSRKKARKSQEQAIKICLSSKERLTRLYRQQNKLMSKSTQFETQSNKIQTFLKKNNGDTEANLRQQIQKLTQQKHEMPACFIVKPK